MRRLPELAKYGVFCRRWKHTTIPAYESRSQETQSPSSSNTGAREAWGSPSQNGHRQGRELVHGVAQTPGPRGHDRDHRATSGPLVEDRARRIAGGAGSVQTAISVGPVRKDVRRRLCEASEEAVEGAGHEPAPAAPGSNIVQVSPPTCRKRQELTSYSNKNALN